jgi:hypothetical protein
VVMSQLSSCVRTATDPTRAQSTHDGIEYDIAS